MGFYRRYEIVHLHHVILLKALLCSFGLNTLDACWIAVDVWSNSSRCRKYRSTCFGRDAYRYNHCIDIVTTLRGSINCSTVICSPTVIFAILREASSEHYGPRVYFTSYFQPYTFTSLHFPPSDLTLQTILKGLTTPLKRWVQACLCLRTYFGLDEALLLDRYLGSQTEGNTYCSCAASPFPLQGKNQCKSEK